MKNETVHSLLEAFETVLSESRKPEKLRTHKGTEFLNQSFGQYLKNVVISLQSILYITSKLCKTWFTLTITPITEV